MSMEEFSRGSSLGLVDLDVLPDISLKLNNFTTSMPESFSAKSCVETPPESDVYDEFGAPHEPQFSPQQQGQSQSDAGHAVSSVPSFLVRPDCGSASGTAGGVAVSPDSVRSLCLSPASPTADPAHLPVLDQSAADVVVTSQSVGYRLQDSLVMGLSRHLSTTDISGYQISARSTSIGVARAQISRCAADFPAVSLNGSAANARDSGWQALQCEFNAGTYAQTGNEFDAQLLADEQLLQSASVCADSSAVQHQQQHDVTSGGSGGVCETQGAEQDVTSDLSLVKMRYFEGFSQPLGALGTDVSGVERPPFGLSHISAVFPEDTVPSSSSSSSLSSSSSSQTTARNASDTSTLCGSLQHTASAHSQLSGYGSHDPSTTFTVSPSSRRSHRLTGSFTADTTATAGVAHDTVGAASCRTSNNDDDDDLSASSTRVQCVLASVRRQLQAPFDGVPTSDRQPPSDSNYTDNERRRRPHYDDDVQEDDAVNITQLLADVDAEEAARRAKLTAAAGAQCSITSGVEQYSRPANRSALAGVQLSVSAGAMTATALQSNTQVKHTHAGGVGGRVEARTKRTAAQPAAQSRHHTCYAGATSVSSGRAPERRRGGLIKTSAASTSGKASATNGKTSVSATAAAAVVQQNSAHGAGCSTTADVHKSSGGRQMATVPTSTPLVATGALLDAVSLTNALQHVSPVVAPAEATYSVVPPAADAVAATDTVAADCRDGASCRPRRSRIPTPVWRHTAAAAAGCDSAAPAGGEQQRRQHQMLLDRLAMTRALISDAGCRSAVVPATDQPQSSSGKPTAGQTTVTSLCQRTDPALPSAAHVTTSVSPAFETNSDDSMSSASSASSVVCGQKSVQADNQRPLVVESVTARLDNALTPPPSTASLEPVSSSECVRSAAPLLQTNADITVDEVVCVDTVVTVTVPLSNVSSHCIVIAEVSVADISVDGVCRSDGASVVSLCGNSVTKCDVTSGSDVFTQWRVRPLVAGRVCVCLSVVGRAAPSVGVVDNHRSTVVSRITLLAESADLCFASDAQPTAAFAVNFGSVPEQCTSTLPVSLVNRSRCAVPVVISVTSTDGLFELLQPDSLNKATTTTAPVISSNGTCHQLRLLVEPRGADDHWRPATCHVQLRTPLLSGTDEFDADSNMLRDISAGITVRLDTSATQHRVAATLHACSSSSTSSLLAEAGPVLVTCNVAATLGRVRLHVRSSDPLIMHCAATQAELASTLALRNSGSIAMKLAVRVCLADSVSDGGSCVESLSQASVDRHCCMSVSPDLLTVAAGSQRALELSWRRPPSSSSLMTSQCLRHRLLLQVQPAGQTFELAVHVVIGGSDNVQVARQPISDDMTDECVSRQKNEQTCTAPVCLSDDAPAPNKNSAVTGVVSAPGKKLAVAVQPTRPPLSLLQPCLLTAPPPPPGPGSNDADLRVRPAGSTVGGAALDTVSASIGAMVQLRSSHSQLSWLAVVVGLASRRSLVLRNCCNHDVPLRITVRHSTMFSFDRHCLMEADGASAPPPPPSAAAAVRHGTGTERQLDVTLPARGDRQVDLLFRPTGAVGERGLLVIKPRSRRHEAAAIDAADSKPIKFSVPLLAYSGLSRVTCVGETGEGCAHVGRARRGAAVQTRLFVRNSGDRTAFVKCSLFWDENCRVPVPVHQCIVSPERMLLPPGKIAQLAVALRVPPGGESNNYLSSGDTCVLAHVQVVSGDEILRQALKRVTSDKVDPDNRWSSERVLLSELRRDSLWPAVAHQSPSSASSSSEHPLHGLKRLTETLLTSLQRLQVPLTVCVVDGNSAASMSLSPAAAAAAADMTQLHAEDTLRNAPLDDTVVSRAEGATLDG